MKNNKINLYILITILIIAFVFFLFLMFKSYNYEKKYVINNYKILEKYNKNKGYYSFYITYKGKTYPYIINSKYLRKKELITNIKEYKNDNELCIIPISNKLKFYPLCSNNKEIYMFNNSNVDNIPYKYKKVSIINKEYNNIKINSLANLSFLIFNYKGFYLINERDLKEIKLFDKDIYSMNLLYQYNNLLIIPDYNKDYYFNRFYLINIEDGKVKEIETNYDISFDSVFLGNYKDEIYLLDKKEEKEYKINIKKRKIELLSNYEILENEKFNKKTYKEIVNNNLNFLDKNIINYEIKDNNLFMKIDNINIKITDKKVNKIIKNDNDIIFYLVKDTLYMFNNNYGEVKLLTNFEWNFNNKNMIFIS